MKSRSGSSGYLNTRMSPRSMSSIGSSVFSRPLSDGAKTNLFTSRWSPINRLFSIDPVGILNAWTTNVRTNSARMTATQIDSKYSRAVDLRYSGSIPYNLFHSNLEHGEKGFLRNLDPPDALHPLLPFLLLLEQLALPGDVAAVALGEHVLAQRLDRLARDDAIADRGLDRDLEHLPRDQLAHLRGQRPAAIVGRV